MNPKNRFFMCSRKTGVVALFLLIVSMSLQAGDPTVRHWTVDGVDRQAALWIPSGAETNASPVIFAFHGHGGNMDRASRTFDYQSVWPEAIVVYMQGLNTAGRLVDREGKQPGWQFAPGTHDDRDLKFFDAVLASLRKDYRVDEKRIYCTGHSNGGGFTYLLWSTRGDVFAAVAPCATLSSFLPAIDDMTGLTNHTFKPKPVLHLAGENDPLVKFAWQKLTMDAVRKVNGCSAAGESWDKECTIYSSKSGTPLVTFIYPGGHQFNSAAPVLIVKFFKQVRADRTTIPPGGAG